MPGVRSRTVISASPQSSESVLQCNRKPTSIESPAVALLVTRRPTVRVMSLARCDWVAPIITEGIAMRASSRVLSGFRRVSSGEEASPSAASQSGDKRSSANSAAYTSWLRENWDYVRFINPETFGWRRTCGTSGCHTAEVRKVQMSMMTHGAMRGGAALYSNGAFPLKTPQFGERYGPDGSPRQLTTFPRPRRRNQQEGNLPYLIRALGNFSAWQCVARV